MTLVTFQRVSNCTIHVPLTGRQRNCATDGGVDRRDWEQGLTEMAHELLVADEEYVVIGGFRKSCKPLVGLGYFHLAATTTVT